MPTPYAYAYAYPLRLRLCLPPTLTPMPTPYAYAYAYPLRLRLRLPLPYPPIISHDQGDRLSEWDPDCVLASSSTLRMHDSASSKVYAVEVTPGSLGSSSKDIGDYTQGFSSLELYSTLFYSTLPQQSLLSTHQRMLLSLLPLAYSSLTLMMTLIPAV